MRNYLLSSEILISPPPRKETTFERVAGLKFLYSLQVGHHSRLTAPNFQPTANEERNDQCGNQHYSRELLMMGIVMPETC